MTSADFCRITTRIPSRRAMPRSVRCLFARLRRATRRSAWALMIQFRPFWNNGSALHHYVRQISPGKNAVFPCTSAEFTLSAVSDGLRHEVPTRPQTRPSMQFLSVASHVCTPASSRQALAALPLPSASGYHRLMSNRCRYSHRGLPPHYTAPMLGAHPAVERTCAKSRAGRSLLRVRRAWRVTRYVIGASPMARYSQSRRQGEGQGRRREAGSEGSPIRNCGAMNKNRI
jgi:hypothetical protein